MLRAWTIGLVILLAGCLGPSSGTHSMEFPTIRAHWSPPDLVAVSFAGHTQGRDIADATIEAYVVEGACPGEHDIPTRWLDKRILDMPPSGRFSFDYDITLNATFPEGALFSAMIAPRHPQTTPSRGWCVEFIAGGNETGTPVYP